MILSIFVITIIHHTSHYKDEKIMKKGFVWNFLILKLLFYLQNYVNKIYV